MLVLSRKMGESIVIPEFDVEITIVRIGKQVRIGIKAPTNVKVLRKELYSKQSEGGPCEA